MILLGYIIEKIYVKALEEVFNEKIKKPLGYTRSKFNSAVWARVGDSVGLYLTGNIIKQANCFQSEAAVIAVIPEVLYFLTVKKIYMLLFLQTRQGLPI